MTRLSYCLTVVIAVFLASGLSSEARAQGFVQMIAQHSGKCADVSGVSRDPRAVVHQWQCLGPRQRNQYWRFERVGRDRYQIVVEHTGFCLDIFEGRQENGARAIQYPCHGGTNQQFRVVQVGDVYQIRAVHSNKCLDVSGVSRANGAILHQWECLGARQRNQLWAFRDKNNRYVSIGRPTGPDNGRVNLESRGFLQMIAQHSGKCADVSGVSRDPRAVVHQWQCLGPRQRNQFWRFERVGRDRYRIVVEHTGFCLDIFEGRRENGARAIQYPCHGGTNQQFRVVRVGNAFQIRAVHSDKCLDVSGASQANGAVLHQWECLGARQRNQLWAFRDKRGRYVSKGAFSVMQFAWSGEIPKTD